MVYSTHSRIAGMTVKGTATERKYPAKPAIHSLPGIPFLDFGLRRNDDEQRSMCIAIQEPRREQAAEESSNLFNPFPRSENYNERNNKPARASDKTCRLFTPRRRLPGFQPSLE